MARSTSPSVADSGTAHHAVPGRSPALRVLLSLRPVGTILGAYSPQLLDQMIGVVTASTLIPFVFDTIGPETPARFGIAWPGLTIPFPLYGTFRYLYLVRQREGGGNPADRLPTDRPLPRVCGALGAHCRPDCLPSRTRLRRRLSTVGSRLDVPGSSRCKPAAES